MINNLWLNLQRTVKRIGISKTIISVIAVNWLNLLLFYTIKDYIPNWLYITGTATFLVMVIVGIEIFKFMKKKEDR